MGFDYLRSATAPATQREKARPDQAANSAGGYVFTVDDWVRLRRFLILGAEGGTYYASERKLTRENAQAVERLVVSDGLRVVREIVEISESGRAPKNDPAILALAIAAKRGDEGTRVAARSVLPRVCRTGTHLYHFAEFVSALGGWGRGTRRAVSAWFNDRPADDLARQLVKYQSRDGWSSRDLLRVAHVRPASAAHDALYRWACSSGPSNSSSSSGHAAEHAREHYKLPRGGELPAVVAAFEQVSCETDVSRVVQLVREHRLPREAIPTQHLQRPEVWEALLPHLGLTALIRNLATMTRVGLIAPMAACLPTICARLSDRAQLARARVHPIQVLSALKTYGQGRGERGTRTWTPVQIVVDALDAGFYQSFASVDPTNRPTLIALDVSSSMCSGSIAGAPGLTPRVASAAMALVTASREPRHHIVGFSHRLVDVPISPAMRLDQAIEVVDRVSMGNTDCALPMIWAQEHKVEVDAFAIYTDNETWHGDVHPYQALASYRRSSGLRARLCVVGMTATSFTIADPSDPGMLDVVGFDAAAPALMADFFRDA